ncbi:MAG TPA: PD-(D/E)XK nuclease family protein, partial [Miltoncostaea sp.]|nr:PD-(D/E)XK nuclease family protein [Miltoncostaea sp.]
QEALRVTLDAAAIRDGRAGEGVLIADHRVAGGLRFDLVVVCGSAEGLLPAGPGADTLVDDRAWQALREAGHPFVEDAARRIARARDAAARAVGAGGRVLLTCPLYEGAGAHEHYPSPVALEAAQRRDPSIATATALREHAGGDGTGWLTRVRSPLAAQLRGPVLDPWEAGMRAAVARVQAGGTPPVPDPIARPLAMLRARAGSTLSEWDGNLAALAGSGWMAVPEVVSPTRLERYGGCGFRFLLSSLLDVRVPDEPADAETIDPVVRGSIVHETLEAFFREQRDRDRPAPGERWTPSDEARLQEILGERLEVARRLGLTGLAVFAGDAERTMRADLTAFLVADGDFRRETGATPWKFEEPVHDEEGPDGQRFRGYVDRIDRILPDGPAWVIDYKTGRRPEKDDQLGGGRLLQLPVYLLATKGVPATALYRYITARGGFARETFDPTPENLIRFANVVASIRAGVAAGAFPASPGAWNDFYAEFENCGRCDFTRICARSRGDDFDRKEADAGVVPWAGVKAAAGGSP